MKNDAPRKAAPPAASARGATASPPSTPSLHHSNALPPIPDHELIRCIGRGAYGEVWLARHARLGTLRAVKIIRRDQFDHDRPFQREFDGIRRYEPISRGHPNLVAILHVGGTDDCFFYVMELADDAVAADVRRLTTSAQVGNWESEKVGEGSPMPAGCPTASPAQFREPPHVGCYEPRTLRSELKQHGALPIDRCVEIGHSLAGALAHLHARGLVHRDVKPSNVIFAGGVAKLADIGLVAAVSDSRSYVGTEGYIPPEGPGAPSANCYALGKLLYELSSGHDRTSWPEPPADLPTRPDRERLLELNAILHRACAPDPCARYPHAEAMRKDLELLQRGSSVRRRQTVERWWTLSRRAALAAVVFAFLVATAWQLSKQFSDSTIQRFNEPKAELNSIAVLPFLNERKYGPHDYLCDALTDETMNALTNCAGLRVASRPTVFAFKRATNDLRQIGERLGVRTVLAGSMEKSSNQLHVAARLLNVADGAQLWSGSFDRDVADMGAVQSEVIRQVARQLNLSIADQALRHLETNLARKLAAYQLYSQTLSIPDDTQEGLNRIIELLNRAIVEDPGFGRAYARLAHYYAETSGWMLAPKHAMTAAKQNALRAIELDDSLAEAHMALGNVLSNHELDFSKAETEFQRAIEVEPHYIESYGFYAIRLSELGRFEEAEQVLKQGAQVAPNALIIHAGWCWRYYLDHRFDEMLRIATNYLAVHTNTIGLMFLGWAHERLGHYDEALATGQRTVQLSPDPDSVAFLGRVHARMGHCDEAKKALEELRVISQSPRGSPLATHSVSNSGGLGLNCPPASDRDHQRG